MIPKGLYHFNHYLMLISLGGLLLVIAVSLVCLPFLGLFSYETISWMCGFLGWAFPILLALFAVSSGVVASGFSQHRIEIKKDEK